MSAATPRPARRAPLASVLLILGLAACRKELPPPPAPNEVDGLPISGSLADARRAGFTACVSDGSAMRCRREGVSFGGTGGLSAAVDLKGADGEGGFDHLTLWQPRDQSALIAIIDKLRTAGWRECLTPVGDRWADQAVYHGGAGGYFVALDRSYWSTRRLMIHPAKLTPVPACR